MMQALTVEQLQQALIQASQVIIANEPLLTQIDSIIGDGDHGTGMRDGFSVLQETLKSTRYPDIFALMRDAGIALRISSNNTAARVRPFAEKLGLPFVSFSLKPAPRGLRIARRALGMEKREMALVGDQVFTDMLAAKFYGITVLMVQPVAPDFKWNIRFKRVLERPILARYYKKGGKLYE